VTVRVEGCIVGGELHAAGLRRLSLPLDKRSQPSQNVSRGGFTDRHHFHLMIPLSALYNDDDDLSKLGEHFRVRAEDGDTGLRVIVIPKIDKISMTMLLNFMSLRFRLMSSMVALCGSRQHSPLSERKGEARHTDSTTQDHKGENKHDLRHCERLLIRLRNP
jgi:hypothetical protein